MLEVREIDVFYGALQALKKVSIEVNKGEIVTVIGSNGAGKTTLLKTIAGLLRPSSGHIEFLRRRIDGMKAHEIVNLGISLVPEGRKLFPSLTVMENLELGAYVARARRQKEDTLKFVFELFPILKERKDQKAGTLSGGEQQMLALGRALMSQPKLLMLDEPSLGLAPKIALKILETVRALNKETGLTILLVEQNVMLALEIADRGYVLETGFISHKGSTRELKNIEEIRKRYLAI